MCIRLISGLILLYPSNPSLLVNHNSKRGRKRGLSLLILRPFCWVRNLRVRVLSRRSMNSCSRRRKC